MARRSPAYASQLSRRLGVTRWDLGALGVISAMAFLHALLHLLDGRVLWDSSRYLSYLPDYYWALGSPWEIPGMLAHAASLTSGWYQVLLASLYRILGRGTGLLPFMAWFWYVWLLVAVGLVGRRLGGPPAGLAAAALTATFPNISIHARTVWLHIPETALVLTALVFYLRDPKLQRWSTAMGIALTGALALGLRESGIVWVATLVPLVLLSARVPPDLKRPVSKILFIGGVWFVSVLPAGYNMVTYLARKVVARERYALTALPVLQQYQESFGQYASSAAIVGGALYLLNIRKAREPTEWLLLVWATLLPTTIFLVFLATFENYTPLLPAAAIVLALGLTRTWRWLALTSLIPLVLVSSEWSPKGLAAGKPYADIISAGRIAAMLRPEARFGALEVSQLLNATCPSDAWHSCHIVVDQGLFMPAPEEAGLLELFQLAEDRVELRSLYDPPEVGWEAYAIHALITTNCEDDHIWRSRAPDSLQRVTNVIRLHGLDMVWGTESQPGCRYLWLAPNGQVAIPGRVPEVSYGDAHRFWRPENAWLEAQAFYQDHPNLANQKGSAPLYVDDLVPRTVPPADWEADEAALERLSIQVGLRRTRERATANYVVGQEPMPDGKPKGPSSMGGPSGGPGGQGGGGQGGGGQGGGGQGGGGQGGGYP